MKWNNVGHEFDEIGKNFESNKKIFIYGAGEYGKILFDKLSFANCVEGFIDNDETKQQSGYCGKQVESIFEFMKRRNGEYIVVTAASRVNTGVFMNQLRSVKYRDGVDLFEYETFVNYYLPIYAVYGWNKVYFHSVGLTLTTICNLRCKSCLAFIPYNTNPMAYDVKMFKQSIDSLFRYVDYVDIFQLSGGETFLYEDHIELVKYIYKNYRNKINKFYTTTNGTKCLNDSDYEELHNAEIVVIVDDYRDTVENNKIKIDRLIEKFEEFKVRYVINKVDHWIDLAPKNTDNTKLSEKELEIYFNACQQPWIELFENKLYSCNYAQYAMRAGIIEDSENDYFNLTYMNENRLKELVEFRMGFTTKGYVDMCKNCSGYIAINKNIVKPAVQINQK